LTGGAGGHDQITHHFGVRFGVRFGVCFGVLFGVCSIFMHIGPVLIVYYMGF